ncbi:MAG: multi-sensor hybrid histidine kinase [Caulobacter sp.]|nr:multi-sensor hybrid histidine kinase [Caulobacter sp.]
MSWNSPRPEARSVGHAQEDAVRDLTSFFEVSRDLLCIRDRQGRFVRVNRAWEDLLGYRPEELQGTALLALIHPDDAAATDGHMRRIHVEGEVFGFVNRYRHRDGSYRHLEWRAREVGDQAFGIARDVTERLAIEAEMQAARREAEAANQAKSDFLANMSHEIRTPLNGVIGVAAALGQTGLTADQREMVKLIESSGVMLERLVSDILDISKIEAGRMELETRVFDLEGDLAALIEVSRGRAHEKGLSFHVGYGERARGAFRGDITRIKQVLGNLLSNAVKFTHQGEVGLRIEIAETGAEGGADSPETLVTFEVSDTGVGFDAGPSSAVFQRFSQADATITRRFGGTGLGLSICRALADLMGGEIAATSEPGRGSLFRVTLPLERSLNLADHDAGRHAARADMPGAALGGMAGLRVLLAEDHPTNRKVVQLILAPCGADVTTVENGAEAVEAFKAGVFDVVLMDMQMPVMDGLAATRAIRAHEAAHPGRARTPIMMLSANAMRQHRADALAAGADLHVAKPVTAVSLITGIETALGPALTAP